MELKLESDAKVKQGSRAGVYFERSSSVNGKPSYSMGDNAIWYNNVIDAWIIGPIDDF